MFSMWQNDNREVSSSKSYDLYTAIVYFLALHRDSTHSEATSWIRTRNSDGPRWRRFLKPEYNQFACVGRSDLWGWQRQTYHGLVYWGISSPIAVGHFNQSLGAKTPPCVETVIIWFFSTTPWIDLPSLHWRGNCIPEYTFAKATKFPYGHLMVDLKPFTLEDQRLKVQYNMPTFLVSTTNCSNTVKHPR